MGSLCSKSSNYEDTPLPYASRPANIQTLAPAVAPSVSVNPDPRAAAVEAAERRRNTPQRPNTASTRATPNPNDAAEAAERRLKAAQTRGTKDSNPKRGKLSEQLAKRNKGEPETQLPERIIWD